MADMESRAALIFAVVTMLIGCGDDDFFPNGDMAAGGHDMGLASDMAKASIIKITAEIDPKTGKPKTTAPALLTAVADVPGGVDPVWIVTHTGDQNGYSPTPTVPSGLTVQFQANNPGTWTFNVSFKSGGSLGAESITLGDPTGHIVFYRFRALPSESTGLPLTELKAPVQGGRPHASTSPSRAARPSTGR